MNVTFYKIFYNRDSIYLDDILVCGKSKDDHYNLLNDAMNLIKNLALKMNPDKCWFGIKENWNE